MERLQLRFMLITLGCLYAIMHKVDIYHGPYKRLLELEADINEEIDK